MAGRESVQAWLEQGLHRLEQVGERALALYESASAVSGGVIPFRPVKPRILGSLVAIAGCLFCVGIVSGSYAVIGGLVEHLRSDPPAEVPSQQTFVLRCSGCGGGRCVVQAELDEVDSRDGSYWCETCRAYSAYRLDVGDACVALPLYEGGTP
jgi:hypothetical protein